MNSPATITSRMAQKNHDKIVAAHSDLINGMAAQSMKVQAFNQQRDQQRAAEMQNKQTMDADIKKSQMVADTASQKNFLDFAAKQASTDVSRAALTTQ